MAISLQSAAKNFMMAPKDRIKLRIVSITLFFLGLSFLSYRTILNNINIQAVPAKNGVIDLRGFNLDQNVVALAGDWEFYWSELFEQYREKTSSVNFQQVPISWNSSRLPWQGFGTYRVKILFPKYQSSKSMALYLNRVGSAYKVFINGSLRGGNGIIGESRELETPHRQTKVYHFDVEPGEDTTLVIQVSNHYHAAGGLKTGILLAESERLKTVAMRFFFVDFFSSVPLLCLTIIFFFVYLFRPEKVFLQFSFFLFLICCYILGTGENILMTVFPELPFLFFMKIIHVAMALHIVMYNILLVQNYHITGSLLFYRFINYSCFLYTGIVIFLSIKSFVTILPLFHVILLLADCYWLFLLIIIARQHRDAWIVFCGVALYSLTVFFEIAYVNQLTHNPRMVPIGFLFLTFSYILVTVKAFANSYQLIEIAEYEKKIAIEEAIEHKNKNAVLTQTLTNSENITAIEKIRSNLDNISYIISGMGACSVYDDLGSYMYDVDLSLRRIEDIFGPGNLLIRCAKGYVINPKKVKKIVRVGRRKEAVFYTSRINNIPVGNKYYDPLNTYLMNKKF